MCRFIFLLMAILHLSVLLFVPCRAMEAIQGAAIVQKNVSQKSGQIHSPQPPVQSSVENVFIDKIEDGAIYSRDGRKFETGGAKVIDNRRKPTGRQQAELFFKNGDLVVVILK